MAVAVQTTFIDSENWKSSFLSFVSNRLDQIEKDDSKDLRISCSSLLSLILSILAY